VTGTFITTNYLANGSTTATPANLTTRIVEAYVPAGDGGYTILPGAGQVNGTFAIPNVPAGNVFVRIDNIFLETSARQLTFTAGAVGRTNAAKATVNPTTTTVAVSGLSPWATATDRLDWISPNVGNAFFGFPLSPTPTAGASTATMSANLVNQTLVNQSFGDDTWVLQRRIVRDGGFSQATIVAGGQIPAFTQQNGQTSTLAVTLQQPPTLPTLTQSISWNLNAFTAFQPSFPGATNPGGFLAFSVTPNTAPNNTAFVDLWAVEVPAALQPPGSFTIASPLPSGWAVTGRVFFVIDTPRQVAGTSAPLAKVGFVGFYDSMSAFTAGTITPRIGPVTNLTLNGTPFTANRTGVGTVTLSWTAPTLGAASTYYVQVERLSTTAGMPTTVAETLEFSTANTSLTIPSNLLIAGQPYVLSVDAISGGAFDPRTEYSTRNPYAVSLVPSPIVTP
jgi:hypothetical protein